MRQKMTSVLSSVKKMLQGNPRLRDSDEKLMANMWYVFIGEDIVMNLTAINLLQKLSDGDLPSYESISRCRRKIQEEKPELRGEKWKERHDAEETVIKELNQMEIDL
jgi:hypothetical protein